jgi:hypothetical protein
MVNRTDFLGNSVKNRKSFAILKLKKPKTRKIIFYFFGKFYVLKTCVFLVLLYSNFISEIWFIFHISYSWIQMKWISVEDWDLQEDAKLLIGKTWELFLFLKLHEAS